MVVNEKQLFPHSNAVRSFVYEMNNVSLVPVDCTEMLQPNVQPV